ncbi:MAG: DUF2079 domain-containing protein [Candidatus Levybacteria bacterium]|nr:DUF2079 domain-containing protein [Candidatus Levybacteria bacterium]
MALFFLGKTFTTQLSHVSSDLTKGNIFLYLVAIMCFIAYFYLRSLIWYKLLSFMGYKLEAKESIFSWSFAQLKRYIPGNIWGIVGVSLYFEKHNVTKKELAKAFIVESEVVLIAGLIVSILGLPILFNVLQLQSISSFIIELYTLFLIIGTVLYIYSNRIAVYVPEKLSLIKNIFPQLSAQHIVLLLTFMTLSFICYGVGTYFVVSAVYYVDPHNFLAISSYLVLSLVVGFLSIITPSGLGVREGVMAVGLSRFIPASAAAFSSLMARIVLIFSELLFLLVMFLILKIKKGIPLKALQVVMHHPYEAVLVVLYGIFATYFSWISNLRYEQYYTGRFDLGNMAQTVWNTLHGNIFELTDPNGTEIVSRLAFHADFFLILLAPFYGLWQDPRLLLVIQAVVTGAGAFFVYAIARNVLKDKSLSLVLSILYLLNPSMQRSVIYDFHAVTLATTFLLGAWYFVSKKRYGWFLIFIILAALTKEQIWVIGAIFGLYVAIRQKMVLFGTTIFFVSAFVFYLLIWHAIPAASGSQHFALSYYGNTTSSPTSLIGTYISSPEKVIGIIFDSERVSYFHKLLAPLGFLSLGAPLFLIFAAPDLGINVLSVKSELYQIYYQYTAAITPFLFVSAIYSIRLINKKLKWVTFPFIIIYLISVGGYYSWTYGPLPGSREANLAMITKPMRNKEAIDRLIASIPKEYSVATSNSIGSHLSDRRYLFTIPVGSTSADFLIINRNDSNPSPSRTFHLKIIEDRKLDPAYVVYYNDDNIIAFRKKNIK